MGTTQLVKIQHEKMGILLEESFINPIQFKLFLKLINGCIEMKQDFTSFNGVDFFTHIPYKILSECVITTKVDIYTITDHLVNKSKIEAEKTK
jgi:hypothetical protein